MCVRAGEEQQKSKKIYVEMECKNGEREKYPHKREFENEKEIRNHLNHLNILFFSSIHKMFESLSLLQNDKSLFSSFSSLSVSSICFNQMLHSEITSLRTYSRVWGLLRSFLNSQKTRELALCCCTCLQKCVWSLSKFFPLWAVWNSETSSRCLHKIYKFQLQISPAIIHKNTSSVRRGSN